MRTVSSEELSFNEFLNSSLTGVWKDASFNLKQALHDSEGSMLEVGGPTPQGYQMIGRRALKGMLISNIRPLKKIDMIANAHKLPFSDESFSAVFSSAFYDGFYVDESGVEVGYRNPMIQEATRVVKKDGLVVLQYGNIRNIKQLTSLGLAPMLAKVNKAKRPKRRLTPDDGNVEWSHTKSLFIYRK